MSREALCDDWRMSLAHCESCVDEAPLRFQWLYRVRARIYRILLAMYGDERQTEETGWEVPDLPEEQPSEVYVAAGVKDEEGEFSSKPLKTKAQMLQTLKRISAAVPLPPRGDFTGEQVRLQPFLVADVVKLSDAARIRQILYRAGIAHEYRVQGTHHQFLAQPHVREIAVWTIRNSRRVLLPRRTGRLYSGLASAGRGLIFCAAAICLAIATLILVLFPQAELDGMIFAVSGGFAAASIALVIAEGRAWNYAHLPPVEVADARGEDEAS